LNKAHDTVDASTHVICRKSPDELVECAGRRADTEEKWYFNEDENETGNAAKKLATAITTLLGVAKQSSQANDAEDDNKGDVEQVRDPKSNA